MRGISKDRTVYPAMWCDSCAAALTYLESAIHAKTGKSACVECGLGVSAATPIPERSVGPDIEKRSKRNFAVYPMEISIPRSYHPDSRGAKMIAAAHMLPCPRCKAFPGQRCKTTVGKYLSQSEQHHKRWLMARSVVPREPVDMDWTNKGPRLVR